MPDFSTMPEAAVSREVKLNRARLILDRTNAFVDPNEADAVGTRLLLPTPDMFV